MKRTSNAKEKNVYVSHKLKLNVEDLRIAKMDTDFEWTSFNNQHSFLVTPNIVW